MKAKYKIVYNRKNKLNKNGEALIQIEVYKNGKRKYLSSGIYVKPQEWNEKKNEITSLNPNYSDLNYLLKKFVFDLENNEVIEMTKGNELSLHDISLMKHDQNNFFDFIQDEINKSKNSRSAISGYVNTLRDLKCVRKELFFSDVNYKLIIDFDNFLKEKKLHANTISKRHSFLKKFINVAIKKDLFDINKNPYKNFKLKRIESDRKALEKDELKRIENLKFSDNTESFELIRDMFLFSCFTGLRFQDIQELCKDDITINKDEVYLNIRQAKTDKLLELPLHLLFDGKAVSIIKKYQKKKRDNIFIYITNQHANRVLKMISFLANTKHLLSFHIARHTFGTNLADCTSDPYLIKELMNHSDIRTSMLYIHNSKKRIENKLKNIDWK